MVNSTAGSEGFFSEAEGRVSDRAWLLSGTAKPYAAGGSLFAPAPGGESDIMRRRSESWLPRHDVGNASRSAI